MNRIFFILLISLSTIVFSCSRERDGDSGASWNQPEENEASSLAVEAVVVTEGTLVDLVRGAGIAEGIREAWVIAEAEGLIRRSQLKLGQRVQQGETLLTLDSEIARRNRDLAEGQYQTALLEFQAAKKSLDNGSISSLQFSQISDRRLSAEVSQAVANDAYENTQIKAPFSGSVASTGRGLGIGNYLNRGTRIARIVDNSSFRTEVGVGEGQILLIREGAAVQVRGNDALIRSGRVSAVSSGSDGSTGNFTVVVEWDPLELDSLKSGMSVDVFIETSGQKSNIIAPVSAIRLREGDEYVFVDAGGTAEPRRIETGNRLGNRVEVLSGLNSGDIVITSGIASLVPGAPVVSTLVDGGLE